MENLKKYGEFLNEDFLDFFSKSNVRKRDDVMQADKRRMKKDIYAAGEKARQDTKDEPKAEEILRSLEGDIDASKINFNINQDTDDEEWYNAFTYKNIKIERISNPIMSKEKYTWVLYEGELEIKCSDKIKEKIFDLFEETYIDKRVGADEFYDGDEDEYMGESVDFDKMSRAELRRYFYNNFIATRANIEKLVDETKDLDRKTQIDVANSLGITACAIYCAVMKDKYGKDVPI